MHFDRMPRADSSTAGSTRVDRLTRRTSRSLALVTLCLIAALLAVVGVVTAAVAIGTTDAAIDRSLEQAAEIRLTTLQQQAVQLPEQSNDPNESIEPAESNDSGGGDDNSGSGVGQQRQWVGQQRVRVGQQRSWER